MCSNPLTLSTTNRQIEVRHLGQQLHSRRIYNIQQRTIEDLGSTELSFCWLLLLSDGNYSNVVAFVEPGKSECDLPFCDNPVTFSNSLFDANEDFTSSDDESLPEEDVHEENFKIYSNPLFEFDDEYISSDVNPLFNEVEDDESKALFTSDSIPPEIDDVDFDPEGDILLLEKLLSDDTSSPLPPKELYFADLKMIKSSIDTPSDFEDDYYDSEGDIIYLESLLVKDIIPNLLPEVFLDRDPRSLEDEPDKDDLESMVNVFDPRIHKEIISLTYVRFTFEDRYYLSLTFVIKIFLPFLTYLMNSIFFLSSGSEDTIFDPDIFAFSFYSLEPMVSHRSGTFMCFNVYLNILNESLKEICSSTCFVPNITMI
ncbi:hypothetical protein Tco_0758418 [Tanacetum coccineum]